MPPVCLRLMTMTRAACLLVAALLLSACAQRHSPTDHAVQAQCRLELEAARTAIQLREAGKTKQAMLQSMPSLTADSSRLLQQLYQIVDEVYAYPDLNQIVYGTYRFEYCAHQLRQQPVPVLANCIAPLRVCQTQFGVTVSRQAVDCVRAVFSLPATSPAIPDPMPRAETP
jgi:hypothetical protein